MTAIDPFTTPVEAEREARANQAESLLANAAHEDRFFDCYGTQPSTLRKDEAATALYAAQAATAHALLSVRDELADIAGTLRLLAKTPAAIQWLADHVTAEGALLQKELEDTRGEVIGLRSSVEAAGQPIASAIGDLTAAVDAFGQAAEPRPRWWQWRIRRALRAAAEPQETAQ
ncbi:hypothetical protein [Streptomyces sp.]|uniref:hypothetical protein n=1 Tax=Streptomyces sp. TaxID=1931 RepID=UPI002F94E359